MSNWLLFIACIQSRPALSLLGYCYYQLQDFVNAADCYEQLTVLNPEVDDYRLYYAQSLYKANLFDEAMKVSSQIDASVYHDKVCGIACYFSHSYFPAFLIISDNILSVFHRHILV